MIPCQIVSLIVVSLFILFCFICIFCFVLYDEFLLVIVPYRSNTRSNSYAKVHSFLLLFWCRAPINVFYCIGECTIGFWKGYFNQKSCRRKIACCNKNYLLCLKLILYEIIETK
uniref:Uncharacterized protein n=1 Tax=Panstrongylus lignarius TaxID=156445 RepID=A0A224Y1Q0_9HEMI